MPIKIVVDGAAGLGISFERRKLGEVDAALEFVGNDEIGAFCSQHILWERQQHDLQGLLGRFVEISVTSGWN